MPTKIEWTDETWNPLIGCSRVSPGCDHCYAIGVVHRGMSPQHVGLTVKPADGPTDWTGEVREVPHLLDRPLRWKRPRRIFVNSLSDLFHPQVDDLFIAKVFAVMALAPQHTFQILTKRPQRMAKLVASVDFKLTVDSAIAGVLGVSAIDYAPYTSGEDVRRLGRAVQEARTKAGVPEITPWPLPNVWLGTSIESDRYSFRADHLRATPAAVRWISAEPLLGPLPSLDLTGIDWVVAGGESGPGARPMHPDWVRDLRDRCLDSDEWDEVQERIRTKFLFKQWGSWAPDPLTRGTWSLYDESEVGGIIPFKQVTSGTVRRVDLAGCDRVQAVHDTGRSTRMVRMDKKAAGRELDGRTWDEYPA